MEVLFYNKGVFAVSVMEGVADLSTAYSLHVGIAAALASGFAARPLVYSIPPGAQQQLCMPSTVLRSLPAAAPQRMGVC